MSRCLHGFAGRDGLSLYPFFRTTFLMKPSMQTVRHVLLALSFAPCVALAQQPVLAEVDSRVKVDTADVQGDALRIPAELRTNALSRPEAVKQLTNNLIVRRAIAEEAVAAGLDKDPAVQGALRVARDRVLSDLIFSKVDAQNKPTPQVLEAVARTNYNANPERFRAPDMVGVSHILIRKETEGAKARAEAILARIKGGADFGEMARTQSEDSASSRGGGVIGFIAAGQAAPEFEAALSKLKEPGELSPVVESRFGFHIIRLDGRRPSGIRPFDEVKGPLMREAEEKILIEKRQEYSQKVQNRVKFNQPAIDAFAKQNEPPLPQAPARPGATPQAPRQ